MYSTLLQYLLEPNPIVNNTHSLPGLPTRWEPESLLKLNPCVPDNITSLSRLECTIFDEDSLGHLLSRSIIPTVSESLRAAWTHCYRNDMDKIIDVTRGGRARHPEASDESETSNYPRTEQGMPKIFPDWAGVQISPDSVYVNRCPGETKLSTKWNSKEKLSDDYYWPIAQVLGYSGKNWKTRYGYIITQEEVVVLRFSREKIGSGLARDRSPRRMQPSEGGTHSTQHQRNESIATVMSGISGGRDSGHSRESSRSSNSAMSDGGRSGSPPAQSTLRQRENSIISRVSHMSLDSSPGRSPESSRSSCRPVTSVGEQSYQEGSSGGEYREVEMKSIPWENHGPGKLTVKLAIWWIHMLAGAPGGSIYMGRDYDELDTWIPENGYYRHISTGFKSTSEPASGYIGERQTSQRPSTPAHQQTMGPLSSSPLSSPPSSMMLSTPPEMSGLPDLDSIVTAQWDGSQQQWRFQTNTGRTGHFPTGILLWSTRRAGGFRANRNVRGQLEWVAEPRGRSSGAARSNSGSPYGSDRSSGGDSNSGRR
ncbi:hypothetical protein FQN54_006462 [Arachnomyces sp. PD_36]|nr:hypothetical protein FQN54_006462 [Arachnomyces sp. PD_36]